MIEKLKPFKHLCMTVGNLPTSYLDSMSYYETLCWFCKFLKDEVVPVVNNNSKVVEELETYVNTYFDNLDVQEEINNKLDEMAESGQLTDIIAQYLQLAGVLAFNNVSDMKTATNLINGSFAKTYGYYSVNDNGGANYKIRTVLNTDVIDEQFIIALNDNNLVAELIIDDVINIDKLGAKNDGDTDNSQIIQNAVNYAIDKNIRTILIPNGEYKIDETIVIKENNGITIKGLVKTNIAPGLKLGTTITTTANPVFKFNTTCYGFVCENINFYDLNGNQSATCFKVDEEDTDGYFARARFEHLSFRNYLYAIDLLGGKNEGYVDGCIFNDIKFDTVSYCIRANHLECTTITNITAEPFLGYIVFAFQSHTLEISNILAHGVTSQDYNEVAFIISGTANYGENVYIHNVLLEDVKYILMNNTPYLTLENVFYTNAKTATDSPILIGRGGGTNPKNNTFRNIEVKYEDESTVATISSTKSQDYTYGTSTIHLDYGYIDGLIIENVKPSSNSLNQSYSNTNNMYRIIDERKHIKNGVKFFDDIKAKDNTVNNPDGTAWQPGEVIDAFEHWTIGSTLGYYRDNLGNFEPLSTPVIATTKNRLNAYGGNIPIVGYPGFNTDNGRPCWWTGTKWVYSDGTQI